MNNHKSETDKLREYISEKYPDWKIINLTHKWNGDKHEPKAVNGGRERTVAVYETQRNKQPSEKHVLGGYE